jgi:hypothetical protein
MLFVEKRRDPDANTIDNNGKFRTLLASFILSGACPLSLAAHQGSSRRFGVPRLVNWRGAFKWWMVGFDFVMATNRLLKAVFL